MPNRNHSALLARAMDGIRLQTRPADRWVIVDDQSTDDSVRVMRSYVARWGCPELIEQPVNLGVIRTFVSVLRDWNTDFLYPAAADDYALPDFFAKAEAAIGAHPGVGVVFGEMEVRDASGRLLSVTKGPWKRPVYLSPDRFLNEFLMKESPLKAFGCSILYRTSALKEMRIERFESLGHGYDNFLWRAIARRYGAYYIPEPLGVWCVQARSVSQAAMKDRRTAELVMNETVRWMRTDEFRSLFPEDYITAWERSYGRFLQFYFDPVWRPIADAAVVAAGFPVLRPAVWFAEQIFRKMFLNLSAQKAR